MPKDAYAMWNKLNKNLIGFDEQKCIDCGECISVCPVGALVSSDFKYSSNAWELEKIPASNPFSSDCALMYYEVKHTSIEKNQEKKIYRVTNDAHYTSLSGAARFGFDYSNKAKKDEKEFFNAIDNLKNSNTILFNSYITNEEALILQKFKEKLGVKLVNNDALSYKKFLNNFSSVTGKSLYNGDLKDLHNSNFVISVGSYLKSDAPAVRYAFNNSISINKGAGLYFHPLQDTTVENFGKKGKTIETIFHSPLAEEAILFFILDQFGENLPENIATYIQSFRESRVKTVVETIKEKVVEVVKNEETGEEKEVTKIVPKKVSKEVEFTYTKLLDMFGANETLLATIEEMLAKKDKFTLVLGSDLYTHPSSENLAKIAGLIEKYTQFKVIIIPSCTNTLGVSQICDLDDEIVGKTFGYNVKADYEISALGDGNLDMPALNQQEGTFVNIDKRVVPTNAALSYEGYTLNDIANEVVDNKKDYTIDYTSEIFEKQDFDKLENHFTNGMVEQRGYVLKIKDLPWNEVITKVNDNKLEGTIIYNANPINQFNEFTAVCKSLKNDKTALYVSSSVLQSLELNEHDMVKVEANNKDVELEVLVDKQLDGLVSYVPTFEKNSETKNLFANYRFINANIKKV